MYFRCKSDYPKPVNESTYVDDNGYTKYRRRTPDDCWVVPYNAELLRKMNCHINIEMSTTVLLIMYLYKYIYKAPDYVSGHLKTDEIDEMLRGRFFFFHGIG